MDTTPSSTPAGDDWQAEIDARWDHFHNVDGSPAEHDEHCLPEYGGCRYKSEEENLADLETWYATEEAEAEARAESDAETRRGRKRRAMGVEAPSPDVFRLTRLLHTRHHQNGRSGP